MPIGEDDFKNVIEKQYYYVDKTPFIQKFLDNHAKVTLITRPRRFGKTLLMSMLYYFFSVEERIGLDIGAHGLSPLFQGLAIEKKSDFYKEESGKYPVIFLTLKGVQNNNWKMLYGSFRLLIAKEFDAHSYLLKKGILTPAETAFYQKILNQTAAPEDYQVSILYLSEFLARYYKQPTILLIDEYDAPLQCAYDYGFYKKAISYFETWFNNSLKGNVSLKFALLTGVLRIAKESIFSGLNNLVVDTVVTDTYSEVFGFTLEEVKQICHAFGMPEALTFLRHWYKGYRFGHKEIYNPWSISNFFHNHGVAKPYWINTSGNGILRYLLSRTDVKKIELLHQLLLGQSVSVTLNEGIIYGDIGKDKSALMTMLLTTGYLTVDQEGQTYNRFTLKIPNEEIKQAYANDVLNHLLPHVERNDFDDCFDALLNGDSEAFSMDLQNILENAVSAFDTAGKECFYQGFLLSMIACFHTNGYMVESNRDAGFGCFDLALIPEDPCYHSVVMEFKRAKSEKDLSVAAQAGLRKVDTNKYTKLLKERQIKTILGYGISFYGKKVYVVR